MAGKLVLAKLLHASHRAKSSGDPSISSDIFYDLFSEFTHLYFCRIVLIVQVNPNPRRRRLQKHMNTREQGSLVAIWELATTAAKI